MTMVYTLEQQEEKHMAVGMLRKSQNVMPALVIMTGSRARKRRIKVMHPSLPNER